jgi:hypothetical protein
LFVVPLVFELVKRHPKIHVDFVTNERMVERRRGLRYVGACSTCSSEAWNDGAPSELIR